MATNQTARERVELFLQIFEHSAAVRAALRDDGKVIVDAEDVEQQRSQAERWKTATGNWAREAVALRERAEAAEAKLQAIGMVRTWRNEDGKSFVFTEDISAILNRAALAATEETPETTP